MSAYQLLTNACEDLPRIGFCQMYSIHLVRPSKKTLSILNKDLADEEHNPYFIKSKTTLAKLQKKLAAKQAKTKDSISLQPSSSFSP